MGSDEMRKKGGGTLTAYIYVYYLRIKKKVALLPAEPFPSWPGMV